MAVVERFPHDDFREAKPNDGYINAIALMKEGAIGNIVTLNFDLALNNALGELGSGRISLVEGLDDLGKLGTSAVIYLHGNVNEKDPEKWVLRDEILQENWKDGWERAVSDRILLTPHVVFVGLGSPTSVLTTSINNIKQATGTSAGAPVVHVVDPAGVTKFAEPLSLAEEDVLPYTWCDFIKQLSDRIVRDFCDELAIEASDYCANRAWDINTKVLARVTEKIADAGLYVLGQMRSTWIDHERQYAERSDANARQLAQLLSGICRKLDDDGPHVRFMPDGVVEIRFDRRTVVFASAMHGKGYSRWAVLSDLFDANIRRAAVPLDIIFAAGFEGVLPEDLSFPNDIARSRKDGDIVSGRARPIVYDINDESYSDITLESMIWPELESI